MLRYLLPLGLVAVGCGPGVDSDLVGETSSALGRRVIEKTRTKAELADAVFSSFDPVTCIQSDVQLFVNRSWNRYNGELSEFSENAFLATIRLTPCDGEPIIVGQGVSEDIDFTMSANERRARLRVSSFPFTDLTHSVDLNLNVDIRWEGIGVAETEEFNESFVDPDTGNTTTTRYRARFNDAVATGVISNGTENWIPEPSISSTLRRETLVSVTRTPRPTR